MRGKYWEALIGEDRRFAVWERFYFLRRVRRTRSPPESNVIAAYAEFESISGAPVPANADPATPAINNIIPTSFMLPPTDDFECRPA
jgi:hypothetical protein